jgi:uncharacterized protein (TIGR02246 family)
MTKSQLAAFAVPVVLALGLLSPSTSAQSDGSGIDATARKRIAKANADWLEAMKRQDVAAIVEPYDDDAVFVTAAGDSVRGRSAIERLMRERFTTTGPVTGGRIVQDGLRVAGTMIYEWGHADLTTARAGAARGRYLTVWHKNGDAVWCIARNLSLPN